MEGGALVLPAILVVRNALVWQSGMAVDSDGAPNAYHPAGRGLDALGNAGRPGDWWALVCNAGGNPIVQGPDDPAPGYYVSTTALVDHSHPATDPRRYVDASTVPYLSVPPELLLARWGVNKGDVAMVLYDGQQCGAIVADVGPHDQIDEGSIALAEALGIPSSPRHGGCSSGVTWVLFRGSHGTPAWPRTIDSIQQQAASMFAEWGGVEALAAVVA